MLTNDENILARGLAIIMDFSFNGGVLIVNIDPVFMYFIQEVPHVGLMLLLVKVGWLLCKQFNLPMHFHVIVLEPFFQIIVF